MRIWKWLAVREARAMAGVQLGPKVQSSLASSTVDSHKLSEKWNNLLRGRGSYKKMRRQSENRGIDFQTGLSNSANTVLSKLFNCLCVSTMRIPIVSISVFIIQWHLHRNRAGNENWKIRSLGYEIRCGRETDCRASFSQHFWLAAHDTQISVSHFLLLYWMGPLFLQMGDRYYTCGHILLTQTRVTTNPELFKGISGSKPKSPAQGSFRCKR